MNNHENETGLPGSIITYMQEFQSNLLFPAYLKLSSTGILLEHGGNIDRFGISQPVLNQPLEKTVFFLDCMLPLKTPSIILPKMETSPGVFADIHIFSRENEFVWVLFLDKTEDERELRQVLQKSNQLQLIEQEYRKILRDHISVDILKLLDIAVFAYEGDQTFRSIGRLPRWFHDLFGKHSQRAQQDHVDLVLYFPFLEVFLAGEAAHHWQEGYERPLISDLWIECDHSGKEYYLEAVAASLKEQKILLVKVIDSQCSSNLLHIQKGREKALAFEKVVKTQKYLREFISNMSHELRTPMNAIIGISQMLTRYYGENLTQKQTDGLTMIYDSGQRLLNLINGLLDLSKIEAGKMPLMLSNTSINDILLGLDAMVNSLIKDKEIRFQVEIPPPLPTEIVTDEEKLRQVLLNLLGNAVKFTAEGIIRLTVYQENERLYFSILDTGIGINKDQLKHIFDEFMQVQSSMSREYGGTGLGLTLCKRLVNLLGGHISVTSKIGIGSEFTFYIPLRHSTHPPVESPPLPETADNP